MQHQANCLNCETVLNGHEHYCAQCGQKTDTHRFTWHHFFHEAWHAVTHTDKGLLSLLKGLFFNPGKVAAEYVGGKHKKYFNPITFAIFSLALLVFANSYLKPFGDPQKQVPQVDLTKLTEEQRKTYLSYIDRMNVAVNVSQKHPNLAAMFTFPAEALLFWLFFRKRGRNYVETLVAIIFIGSFATVVFSLVFSPLVLLTPEGSFRGICLLIAFIGMISYIAWGMKGFFANPVPPAYWKTLLVALLYYVLMMVTSITLMLFYVFQSQTTDVIKRFMAELSK